MLERKWMSEEEEKAAERRLRYKRIRSGAFDHRSAGIEREILRFFLAAMLTFAVLLLVKGGMWQREQVMEALAKNTDLSFSGEVRKGLAEKWEELTLAVGNKRGEN